MPTPLARGGEGTGTLARGVKADDSARVAGCGSKRQAAEGRATREEGADAVGRESARVRQEILVG